MTADSQKSAWHSGLINDPRDVAHLRLMAECSLLIPTAAALFYFGTFPWWVAVTYWAVWALVFLDRFTLMLHCVSHRPLFTRRWSFMNRYIPWVLGPLMGQSPETYFAHHMGMHHREGNLHDDLSSTMKYQRDNLFHWLRYFFRFFFFASIELAFYLHKRGNQRLMRRMIVGESSFYLLCAAGLYFRPLPTLVVFVVPFVTIRFLMMAGNWGQHAFVDRDEPENDFKSSITCINSRYNRRCYNDGYHIIHHLKPTMHFADMDVEFEENRELYGQQDALVFEGIDFFIVWLMLMTHQHRWLARRYVKLPGAPERTEDELVELMKSRLTPIPRPSTVAST